ncbi:hypothetical protein F3Y22_tig00015125pilonHSYRG00020 [Hibiscus syriacus]|uniref:Uncharacterized protein n=1 Tax=Hibiscus syriacus TaxID=106335 RepID=A0A6A3BY85_HIBSY|nr:hypothetical protein F3Y22_tig00015125pilonHSYRG00020 [Hibiscus syriacus]
MRSLSGFSWSTVECGNVSDDSSLSLSLSQDQIFCIVDFSPKWAYIDQETEVLIIGTFLKSLEEVSKYRWSCMFGEVEVPAEVIADGILSSHAPPHNVGPVPFYITCSNRLPCSELREFDYRAGPLNHHFEGVVEKRELITEPISMNEEECHQIADPSSGQDLSKNKEKECLLQKLMKKKLYSWLLHKIMEDGKGPNILDEKGQGVLHLASALGYDWAIKPTVTAGVSIDFRDANGWTAPGALSDPSPEFPLGRTPADLASVEKLRESSDGVPDEHAISFLTTKARRSLQSDGIVNTAATQIQRKFRGWKKRKEFLGHQVRKQYRTIIWSVGILEKVVLRWRRKGSGLRGFRKDAITKEPEPQGTAPEEDDYDFHEGRKQTEERMQKTLTRVKSMAQNPEGRGQYRRLLILVQGIQENKACNMVLNSTEVANGYEGLLDVNDILDDDAFMPFAFE